VREKKAEPLHAIYESIVVAGETIVSGRLTPEAQALERPSRFLRL